MSQSTNQYYHYFMTFPLGPNKRYCPIVAFGFVLLAQNDHLQFLLARFSIKKCVATWAATE